MKVSVQNSRLTLEERLALLPDFRRDQGKMHSMVDVLLIVIMAIMSGITGLRGMGDFVKRNKKDLKKHLKPRKGRLPSYHTITRVLEHLEFEDFAEQFHLWTASVMGKNGEWISMDGKGINGTLEHPNDACQKVTQLVSAFLIKQKQVIGVQKIQTKTSEISAVKDLLNELGLKGKVFRLDALHCQKETAKALKESGNEYVLQVKGNQPKLEKHIEKKGFKK